MIKVCITLLPNDKLQAIPADIGKIIKPTPVPDKIIEGDVAVMITIESTDSNTVVVVLNFFDLFSDLLFLSLKYVIVFSMLIICLLKLLTSFSFFPFVPLN